MGYYEKNKQVLSERYLERYSDILKCVENEISEEYKVESVTTRDSNHALVVEKGKEKYRLNSAYRPLEEAKKWVEQYELQNIGVNIYMFGFGNGVFVRELLHKAGRDANIYLWEPDASIFQVVMKEEDLEDIIRDERLHFYIGENGLQEIKEVMSDTVVWHNVPTQIRCCHICYNKMYEKQYKLFIDIMSYANSMEEVRRNTNAHFAHTVVCNVIENLRFVQKSNYITELIGKIPKDIPAIVVSAGPSLDKNIDLLIKAEGRAFIIATDTAVRVLETKNLPYDCIVTVDPEKPTCFLSDYPGCKDVPLFCMAESEKETLKFHVGRKIWAAGSVYVHNLYTLYGLTFPEYKQGGCVATVAVQIASQLNLKNIILIGQDLAFTGEHTHAGGFDNHILDEEASIGMAEGIDGGQVKTRGDWVVYRKWFEDFIKEHEDINLIDATEGGALIHGSKVMSFEAAIKEYCEGKEFSLKKLLDKLPATFDIIGFEPIKNEICSMDKGFYNILSKSKEAKKAAKEILEAGNKMSSKKHDRLLKEIRKANKFIWKQAGYELLDMYTAELMQNELRDVNQITGDARADEISSMKYAIAIYEKFINAVENLHELLKNVLQEV